ncbi:MAG: excinuclease ABC subunit UvrC [Rhodospirillales bacterium]|nr:excinuclease ABC subunit UvrC [Rhodospirillales bacterium]MCB9995172.1 excinuclease ABC subunit UvrC [Rhodospirillales bacterium]
MTDCKQTSLERGAALIRRFARTLPETPGVYRMLDADGNALYVGKAKALKKRVVTYAQVERLPVRLKRMVAETQDMMFIHTHTEVEALLLESNLIKKLKPRYNVLMRDDKSFPYIVMTKDHDFPLLTKHRGPQKRKGDYFGPFASGGAVNRTIQALQKAFLLRNCSDNVFSQRSRPCLQYHIKRCTAPCVDYVSKEEYAQQVAQARAFLSGKSTEIQEALAADMQKASDAQDYETAAKFRDRIRALTAVQAQQDINIKNLGDADVIGLYKDGGKACVQVFFFRGGQNFGNRAYFPRHAADEEESAILGAFIAQFYENKPIPPDIITSHVLAEKALLEEAFSNRKDVPRQVKITAAPGRGTRKRLVEFVVNNARDALARETLKLASERALLEQVAALFELDDIPQRIEVYDNSHIAGTNMVGGMIVAGAEGFRKTAYRKFNIRQAAESDDYGMMREVMERRFGRALKEGRGPGSEDWPDVILIDGGLGQLSAVMETLTELGIQDDLTVVSIAKGPDRNAGREKFFMPGRAMFQLPENDPALHYLQRLRDEAHRFAIGAHRTRRTKDISKSPLDGIPGIGAKRKKALLHHFGSGEAVAQAGLKDLQAVDRISQAVAETIYAHFHETE